MTRSGLEQRRAREGQLAIALAAVAWSTAGLAQRQLDATPVTQVAGRAAFAALALFGLVLATERSGTVRAFREMGRWGLAMTVFLGVSSGVFLLSLNYTTVANVLFMQAAAPMMAALLAWLFLRERIDGRTWLSLLLAGAGVVLMAAGSFEAGAAAIFLPLLMTASFAAVIVIARHRREVSMMPATCASQVLVVAAGPTLDTNFHVVGTILDRAWVNGDMTRFQQDVQTVAVPAGGGAVFDVKIDQEGLYPFVSHAFAHVDLGQVGLLKVGHPKGTMTH